jgi:hypothetical protein
MADPPAQPPTAVVTHLSRVRKARARAEKEAQAATNRAKFGRTRAERQRDTLRADALRRTLDGARREEE